MYNIKLNQVIFLIWVHFLASQLAAAALDLSGKDRTPSILINEQGQSVGFFERFDDNLVFVLERVTEERYDFWQKRVNNAQTIYIQRHGVSSQKKIGGEFLRRSKSMHSGFNEGLTGFRKALNSVGNAKSKKLEAYESVDLWVGYVFNGGEIDGPLEERYLDFVEMIVTVTASTASVFSSHLGITRLEVNYPTPHLSIPLHVFCAKVIKKQYPQIVFMLTTPTPYMASVFSKHFDADYVLKQDENAYSYRSERWESEDYLHHELAVLRALQPKIKPFNIRKREIISNDSKVILEIFDRNFDLVVRFNEKGIIVDSEGQIASEEIAPYLWFMNELSAHWNGKNFNYPPLIVSIEDLANGPKVGV